MADKFEKVPEGYSDTIPTLQRGYKRGVTKIRRIIDLSAFIQVDLKPKAVLSKIISNPQKACPRSCGA